MDKVNDFVQKLSASESRGKVFSLFNRMQFELNAAKALSQTDFYTAYKNLFLFSLILSLVAQAASLVSEFEYFKSVLSVKLSHLLLLIATGLAVIVLEFAKYFVINRVFCDLFRLAGARVPFGLAAVAVAISALSVWASICGGGELAVDTQKIESAANQFVQEIATIRQEIADIKQRNTWKNKTWIAGADKKLLHAKEAQLAAAIAAKNEAIVKAQETQNVQQKTYQYAFAAFEIIFIACTLWCWYFRKRVAVEAEINSESQQRVHKLQQLQQHTQPQPQTQQKIGFTFGNENRNNENRNNENRNDNRNNERICKHCGSVYTHKHHKQLYCCDDCRVAAWELRTGKKIKIKK